MLKRHKNIKVCRRVACNIKKCHAKVSSCTLEYYDNLKNVLERVPPKNIYNYDIINLPGKKNLITTTSIVVYGSASGII